MICMNKKYLYSIIIGMIYFLVFAYVPAFENFMVKVSDGFLAMASDGKKAEQLNPKKRGKRKKKPINFVVNVEVMEIDLENKKLKGIGLAGSPTARQFLYQEVEIDLSNNGKEEFSAYTTDLIIEDLGGIGVSMDYLKEAKIVHIHGKNNKNGTFEVNKIVIVE